MENHIPVEGSHGLYRDSNTSAIINKDKIAYKAYLNRKKACLLYTSPSPRD